MARHALKLMTAGVILLASCAPEAGPSNQSQSGVAVPVETPRPQGEERLILAFGDSLYAGYGLGKERGLPPSWRAGCERQESMRPLSTAGSAAIRRPPEGNVSLSR